MDGPADRVMRDEQGGQASIFKAEREDNGDRQPDRLKLNPCRRTASSDKTNNLSAKKNCPQKKKKKKCLNRSMSRQTDNKAVRPPDTAGQVGNSFHPTHTKEQTDK